METITKEISLTTKGMATACFKLKNKKYNIKVNLETTKSVDLDSKHLTMKLLILEIFKMI
jgi:hypothetical protein